MATLPIYLFKEGIKMKKIILLFLFVIILAPAVFSQATIYEVIVANSDGGGLKVLKFGIDPGATEGIDINLQESNLPPFPPVGAFEARFLLPENNFSGSLSSYSDFRGGNFPFSGTLEYRLQYQLGAGDSITIAWNFPGNVTGRLQDIIIGSLVDVNMSGAGSTVIPNPGAINKLKMMITYNNIVSDVENENLPGSFRVSQNYPNPFNPSTKIDFQTSEGGDAELNIYDVNGNLIEKLFSGYVTPGSYSQLFNADNYSSGTYIYSVILNGRRVNKIMTLIK